MSAVAAFIFGCGVGLLPGTLAVRWVLLDTARRLAESSELLERADRMLRGEPS